MRVTFCAMLAGLWAMTAAPASAQEVMLSWSPAEMKSILASLKAEVTGEDRTNEDNPNIEAKSANGLKFDIYGAECEKIGGVDRCRGLEFAAVFNLGDEEDVEEALSELDYAAVSIFDDGDGDLKLTRYLILDKGVTRGNLEVNLEVFLAISHKVWDYLDDEGFFDN